MCLDIPVHQPWAHEAPYLSRWINEIKKGRVGLLVDNPGFLSLCLHGSVQNFKDSNNFKIKVGLLDLLKL